MNHLEKTISGLFVAQNQDVRELNTLHTATVALLNAMELDLLWQQILTVALDAVGPADRGMLVVPDPASGEMHARAVHGYADRKFGPGSVVAPAGSIAQAICTRTPVRAGDGSRITVPLLLSDQVLGVLELEASERESFTDADLSLLATFAATASIAIRNAQLYAQVQRQVVTDHLTGLHNRRGLFDLAPREIERARRLTHQLAFILFDVDHLTRVNDTYGRAAGDQVIVGVAERCRKNLRHIDILARYSGEEFAALLPETDLAMLYPVAERLRLCVSEAPFETQAGPVAVTISLGVAMLTDDTPDLAGLLDRTDDALYAAQRLGGNHLIMR